MNSSLLNYIESQLEEKIIIYYAISGGDTSEALKVTTSTATFFIKINNASPARPMFEAERYGLNAIAESNTVGTPKIHLCDSFNEWSFLVMDFIESKVPNTKDFELLGSKLAELHYNTHDYFGFTDNNFIGSLPQVNKTVDSWSEFYTYQRLMPQLQLAQKNKLLNAIECPDEQVIEQRLNQLCDHVKPSLLHGDLWSGNYLISSKGIPYLIDPAVYYGHNEIDIAMSLLFGGFSASFYEAYFSHFKKETGFEDRIQLYQLYYYLVHLNLFGRSYYPSVASILQEQFKM